MKIWIIRILILLFLLTLAPVAEWMQRMLGTSFGEGDGVITSFYINFFIAALPTLSGFLIVGIWLWWFRLVLSMKPVMLIICSLIITFGVLNFAAEVFISSRPRAIGDDKDHRVPNPYIEFKGSLESGQHNSLGYGGKVPATEKKSGEYRVFFLGGSTVRFGDPPIPELVEQRFHADGYGEVQVFNFGVSGSNTSMELARLVFEVLEYEPDMVVSYSGGNDIHLPLIGDPRPGYPFNFMIRENHPLLDVDYPIAALIAHGSYLARIFGQRYFSEKFSGLSELKRNVQWNTEAWRVQFAEIYVDNIKSSARITEAFGSEFVAFLQPSMLTKQRLTEAERVQLGQFTGKTEKALGVSLADWQLQNDTFRAEVRSQLDSNGQQDFNFVDMTTVFDGVDNRTYVDMIHTEQISKTLLADQIYEVLLGVRARQVR